MHLASTRLSTFRDAECDQDRNIDQIVRLHETTVFRARGIPNCDLTLDLSIRRKYVPHGDMRAARLTETISSIVDYTHKLDCRYTDARPRL